MTTHGVYFPTDDGILALTTSRTDIEQKVATREMAVVADLMGGSKTLKQRIETPIEAHEMILRGIPQPALEWLVRNLVYLKPSDVFEAAFGMSERTYQRHKAAGAKVLNAEQSARTWRFARLLGKAARVFGEQLAAERWMTEPATGLDGRRPIELIATPVGAELVETFLDRIDYGVYA
jgi:putative toxin-antitoxin system antitoxin component (TIGR02293 family)